MAEIPKVFDQPDAAFMFLAAGIKFPPMEKEWQKKPHTFQEAQAHAARGGNVGAIAGNAHLGLDLDHPPAFKGLTLPESTRWETRPGRYGLRFICKDITPEILAKYGKKGDLAQFKIFDSRETVTKIVDEKERQVHRAVGEIKLQRTYQVIPPSWKSLEDGQRADYKLIDEIAPAEISLAWLLSELQKIGLVFNEMPKKSSQAAKMAANQAATPEGDRNNALNIRAYTMGGYIAAGRMEEADAVKQLTEAALKAGLDKDEAERTIKSGIEAGKLHPIHEAASTSGLSFDDVAKKVPVGEDGERTIFLHSDAAHAIMRKLPVALAEDGQLHYWHGQTWKPDAEAVIHTNLDELVANDFNLKHLREVIALVKAGLSFNPCKFDSNPFLMPLEDGVIDLKSGAFRESQKEDYFTFRYNARYNGPADFKPFLRFLCSCLPDPRDVLTALDIITAIALRIPFDAIVLLFGGGSNGKGVFEKVILALFTLARASAVGLDELKGSRFGPGALLGKDVWIVSEVESVKDATSALKKIATGELIDADVKYGKQRVQGRPHLLPILDANLAFDFHDNSYGRKRRIIKLDFPFVFGDAPNQRPIDRDLETKLTRPEVLAGIVQIIAVRAPTLARSRNIYRRKTAEEQEEEYKRQRFSLNYFCNECLRTEWPEKIDPMDSTTTPPRLEVGAAYAAYLEYCALFNVTTPAEKTVFGKYIFEKYGTESVGTSTTENGKRRDYRFYPGLYLVTSAKTAYAEAKLPYYDGYDRTTTGLRQAWIGKTDNCSNNTTGTTGDTINSVLAEILEYYEVLESQDSP